jgi:hypothetical protein
MHPAKAMGEWASVQKFHSTFDILRNHDYPDDDVGLPGDYNGQLVMACIW